MKVVILAGGLGTRLGEETVLRPKPMVEIGGKPILWHIMKIYSSYGFNEFVILTGYKHEFISKYFLDYKLNNSNFTIELAKDNIEIFPNDVEDWKVTVYFTGKDTLTGGRIGRVKDFIGNEPFMLTYGDGVSDVNIKDLLKFHESNHRLCTMTVYQPEGRFGVVKVNDDNVVNSFQEKPKNADSWINIGFFVCQPEIFNYITEGDSTVWELSPLRNLANDNQLMAYKHKGFWRPMDMLKDKEELNKIWQSGQIPWKIWK